MVERDRKGYRKGAEEVEVLFHGEIDFIIRFIFLVVMDRQSYFVVIL